MSYWGERYEKLKTMLDSVETQIMNLSATGAIEEYSIDTGQTKQSVNHGDSASKLASLTALREKLVAEIAVLEARLNPEERVVRCQPRM